MLANGFKSELRLDMLIVMAKTKSSFDTSTSKCLSKGPAVSMCNILTVLNNQIAERSP